MGKRASRPVAREATEEEAAAAAAAEAAAALSKTLILKTFNV